VGRRSLLVAGLQTAGVPNDPGATLDGLEPVAIDECSSTDPGLRDPAGTAPGHEAACILLTPRE
jgi:hypothetical protein